MSCPSASKANCSHLGDVQAQCQRLGSTKERRDPNLVVYAIVVHHRIEPAQRGALYTLIFLTILFPSLSDQYFMTFDQDYLYGQVNKEAFYTLVFLQTMYFHSL